MKTDKNILIAFLLNFGFSILEFIGGAVTGSVAIISDALHDMGDAISIGASWFLERKSKKQPDNVYTYGYRRYSVLGSLITTVILLVGSLLVTYNAVMRIIHPVEINYNGMILFAVFGVIMNLAAAWFTREGDSLNQKAVNLHMLEDVLGWVVVLVGAIVMRFTSIRILDPLMSIGVAVFIFYHAVSNLKEILSLFLEKIPEGVNVGEIREHLTRIEGVLDVHHVHVWSMDGTTNYATMHVVANGDAHSIKRAVREELAEHGIAHATLELESEGERCQEKKCYVNSCGCGHHHHHGHSHSHGHHHHRH